MGRYELTDFEFAAIEPHFPNKPRGKKRVDDRRVLNGIFWVLRSGARWSDVPERYGPPTTIYNRFNRWQKKGVWDRLMDEITTKIHALVDACGLPIKLLWVFIVMLDEAADVCFQLFR